MTKTRGLQKAIEDSLGRRVKREEIALALGVSVATYTRWNADGITADATIAAADGFGLSRTLLLVDVGILDLDDVRSAAGVAGLEGWTDREMLAELADRAAVRELEAGA